MNREDIFEKAIGLIAAQLPALLEARPRRSVILNAAGQPMTSYNPEPVVPSGNPSRPSMTSSKGGPGAPIGPLPDSYYSYRRAASSREGSMTNWVPRRLLWKQSEQLEREQILERAVDLGNSDAQAAGIIDRFATCVVGAGLFPQPSLDADALGIDDDAVKKVAAAQSAAFRKWSPFADASERNNFGLLVHLMERSLVQFGEYLVTLPMIDDPLRPYALAVQVIHPMRLKTPVDLWMRPDIKDGVEMGTRGEPIAYWIKKSVFLAGGMSNVIDVSSNFTRVPAKIGHRRSVLHRFLPKNPEQTRGWPTFTPAMKMFHDLNELLDAELVSNIVTAAFSLFIKLNPGANPWDEAMARSTWQFPTDGVSNTQPPPPTRYEGFEPGKIYYGNVGEEMQPIKGDRPGNTFEAFTRLIKKAIALSAGLPYAVAFADTDGISFAGYRSAMLEAWRTFTFHRAVLANQDCQTIWAMLQEESYLRGEYDLPNFYTNFSEATRCVWRGAPKGDIEPIKAAQADILLIQNNLKTREEAVMERGGELEPTFDKLAAEQEEMTKLGLYDGPVLAVPGESKQQAGAAEGDAAGASGVGSVGQPAGPAPPGVTKGPASAKPAAPAAAPETEDARLIMAYLRTLSVRIEEIHDNVETMRQEAAV